MPSRGAFRKCISMGSLISEAAQRQDSAANSAEIRTVVSYSAPYNYYYDRYQAYYAAGIQHVVSRQSGSFSQVSLARFPGLQRQMRRLRSSYRVSRILGDQHFILRSLDGFARALGGPIGDDFHPLVGRYRFSTRSGGEVKVCVDSADAGEISSPKLLNWSDLYFKTNYWSGRDYPAKISPLYNGNPLVLSKRKELQELRGRVPTWDLCFVVRVWGGQNEIEGIEHNLRLIEAVNRLDCRKFVLAYLVAGDVAAHRKRLESQGIACTTVPMKLAHLWDVASRSNLNILRLGMHGCVPWRMTDMLAMGACPVLDQRPNTTWSNPLGERRNFLNLSADLTEGKQTASEAAYSAIPELLADFLNDEAMIRAIREENARYFDQCVCPEEVGRQICEKVLAVSQ